MSLLRRALVGQGSVAVPASRDEVWAAMLDPDVLRLLIPGADLVERRGSDRYHAALSFGVGRVRGHYRVDLQLSNVRPPCELDLAGCSGGPLGSGNAVARVELAALDRARTRIAWAYDGVVTGPVAMAGSVLLQASSRMFVGRFFDAFSRRVAVAPARERRNDHLRMASEL